MFQAHGAYGATYGGGGMVVEGGGDDEGLSGERLTERLYRTGERRVSWLSVLEK